MRSASDQATRNPLPCGRSATSPVVGRAADFTSGPATGCAAAEIARRSENRSGFTVIGTRRSPPPSMIGAVTTFRGSSDHEPMLSVEEAQERVLELVTPLGMAHV